MYASLKEIIKKYNVNITGIIHLGGCKGEELFSYYKNDINNVLLVEANPDLIKFLKIKKFFYNTFTKMKIDLENFAATDSDNDILTLNVTNNIQSSSILKLHKHSILHPEVKVIKEIKVKSYTINSLFQQDYDIKNFNFMNLDIQGAELLALKGSDKILQNIKAIYTEINYDEVYKDCALINDLDEYLKKFNFKRVYTTTPESDYWGDALYLRI
jgi:FkbM family methyltransferase